MQPPTATPLPPPPIPGAKAASPAPAPAPARKAPAAPPPPPPAPDEDDATEDGPTLSPAPQLPPKRPNRGRLPDEGHLALLRGFMRYIQRPGTSVRTIWESERITDDEDSPYIRDVISLDVFAKYAANQHWRERRDEHWREVRQRVEDHVKAEHVRREIAEVEVLMGVQNALMPHITGTAPTGQAKPKSLEGAVEAFIKLDRRISEKRQYAVEEVSRGASGDGQSVTVAADAHEQAQIEGETLAGRAPAVLADTDGFDDLEILAMAEAAAKHRMEASDARFRAARKGDNAVIDGEGEDLDDPGMTPEDDDPPEADDDDIGDEP